MTRDADIERIAAVLAASHIGDPWHTQPPKYPAWATALYDAGLRPSVEPRDERWQMVEKDGGYLIAEVDSGRELTTTPIGEREALRLAAAYNVMAHSALRPSVEPLDVERLARALHRWEARHDPERMDVSAIVGVAIYEDGDLQTAQEIAAEYAALPTQASDSPEKP